MRTRYLNPSVCLLLGTLAGSLGCSGQEEIRVYQVKKEQLLSPANRQAYDAEVRGTPHRLWGAIVLHAPQAWFFKVTGPNDIVSGRTADLAQFLESVKFEDGKPTWTLPEHWRDGAARPDRFATLQVGGAGPTLELAVTQLSLEGWEPKDYLLQNVNRWRGQLGLAPLTKATLVEGTREIKLPGGDLATIVEGEGRLPRPGAGPMAGMLPPNHPPTSNPAAGGAPPTETAAAADERLSFKLPAGWTAAPLPPFASAAFTAREGNEQADVTISALPTRAAEAGKLLPNVNRWRGQLQLGPITEAELPQIVQPTKVGDVDGHFVELQGPPEANPREGMLAAMFVQGDTAWFVKLRGSIDLVAREKAKFQEFLASLRVKDDAAKK